MISLPATIYQHANTALRGLRGLLPLVLFLAVALPVILSLALAGCGVYEDQIPPNPSPGTLPLPYLTAAPTFDVASAQGGESITITIPVSEETVVISTYIKLPGCQWCLGWRNHRFGIEGPTEFTRTVTVTPLAQGGQGYPMEIILRNEENSSAYYYPSPSNPNVFELEKSIINGDTTISTTAFDVPMVDISSAATATAHYVDTTCNVYGSGAELNVRVMDETGAYVIVGYRDVLRGDFNAGGQLLLTPGKYDFIVFSPTTIGGYYSFRLGSTPPTLPSNCASVDPTGFVDSSEPDTWYSDATPVTLDGEYQRKMDLPGEFFGMTSETIASPSDANALKAQSSITWITGSAPAPPQPDEDFFVYTVP